MLPPWVGSIRFRLAALYSLVVWGLAAMLVAGIYMGLSRDLERQTITERRVQLVENDPDCLQIIGLGVVCRRNFSSEEVEVVNSFKAIEKDVNQRALDQFRRYSYWSLAGLFLLSLLVGWILADRALRPIGRIGRVARRIGVTDLSERIALQGPNDELKELADTFDDMLGRIEQAFESQRTFIHEASHELRNPIAIIRANVDVALQDPQAPTEDLRETLSVVGRAAGRMGVLVDDLLIYARREVPAERATFLELGEVIGDTAAEFAAAAEARGITLTTSAEAALLVRGDSVALKQAFINLVANAVRLAPEASTIWLTGGRSANWVWMACTDQGPGIAPADQPLVFERFWRAEGTSARSEGRSGLGLTIVRQIARSHGGGVGLESVLGQGSTFSIWLPSYDDSVEGPASIG